jgi:hypothetical protein
VAYALLERLHCPSWRKSPMKATRNPQRFVGLPSSQLSKVTGGTGGPRPRKTENPLPGKFENPLPGKSKGPGHGL